jgi:hypothetical protein
MSRSVKACRFHTGLPPPTRCLFVQKIPPITRHATGGTRHGLIFRMGPRRREIETIHHFLSLIVPEPILAGFEARGY